jgi:hypothetical protein
MAPMPTFTASRRAVVATALGLAMSLSVVACSRVAGLDAPTEAVGDASPEPSAPLSSPTPTRTPAGGPTATLANRYGEVGCLLLFIDGYLVADNGRVFLTETQGARPGSGTPLDFPDDWTVRPTDDGQLEIEDDTGTVRARTGAGIVLHAVSEPAGSAPWIRDGELVVCPGEWPTNYMDPDYVAPD